MLVILLTFARKITQRMKKVVSLLLLMLCHTLLYAQIEIRNPKEKVGLSVSIDGLSNSDYSWDVSGKDNIADGRMKRSMNVRVKSGLGIVSSRIFNVSVSPFYNYRTTRLQTDWQGEQMFNFPKEHHHYGATVFGSMNMLIGKKPMTIFATTAPNFSQYGYENMSGMYGAMVHLTMTQDTYFALGAIYLYGSPFSWPLYPLVILRHKFNDRWSVNCMEVNDFLYYQASPKVRYALGAELVSDWHYFRPKSDYLPKKAIYSLMSERVGLYAELQATKELSFQLSAGTSFPIWGRVRESGHKHVYMKLHDDVKPFVQLKLNYSLKRQ